MILLKYFLPVEENILISLVPHTNVQQVKEEN